MKSGFTITKDHIADQDAEPGTNANAVGVVGPRTTPFTSAEIAGHPDGQPFRMLDDDDHLYYEGVYVGPDDERMFLPLDAFGSPNAGCTQIQYKNAKGEWATL